ncbi:DUF1054 domain-containing protein [Cohnella lubricantis]|uniref:UPF0637 protein H4Q31_07960 n=1 Tax=Cohnella lubricantis TaxID=2163172 RepID=A0A841TFL2_9BACL|nr:DUF1054 domain-containing protein [Cohnella lubricantis]MBB6677261.1 DUF1054 domain-containing protein [Cohnella lubricantis]MBP2116928.1 uncharacterized protein YktB (UPF0637 family) [Cohnella lubricantis]
MTLAAPSVFTGLTDEDFNAMSVPGLEGRMEAIIGTVRPKLHALGDALAPVLAGLTGENTYPHVAKHARRSVNPPDDTWVAWSPSARGYKAFPHYQIGLWSTHLFIQFAIIYECPNKTIFAERAARELASIREAVPPHYVWSKDHMVPTGSVHGDLSDDELAALFQRLGSVKASELTCGVHIRRGDPLLENGDALLRKAESVFATLLPLYKMAQA